MSPVSSGMRSQFVTTVLHNTTLLSILFLYFVSVSYTLCKKLRSHSKTDICNFIIYTVSVFIHFYTSLIGLMMAT